MQFVFITRFEMLSVFTAGQEVVTLGDFHCYEHSSASVTISGLEI